MRLLNISATIVFVISVLIPFLQVESFQMNILELDGPTRRIGPENLWSFKESLKIATLDDGWVFESSEWWFAYYWVRIGSIAGLEAWVGPALNMLLSTAILNALTTLSMWLVRQLLNYHYVERILEAGFWLTFPSCALFVAAFLLRRKLM